MNYLKGNIILKIKYFIIGLFMSMNLYAGNTPLNFTTLDMNDPSSKKVMELIQKDNITKFNFKTMKSFYKINNDIYLYDNCNAPRFSGINIINLKKETNEQIALSKCSLASSNLIMFNIDPFAKEFRLVTTYHEDTYFRVSESKCDFEGNCEGNNLLTYRIPEPKASLCKDNEKSMFSCATGEKIISLCATQYNEKDKNILTYRFGKPNNIPELEYQSKENETNKYFTYAKAYYGNGSIEEMSFKKGAYLYTIYQGRHNYRDNSAGLLLEKNGKKIANFSCNNNTPESSWHLTSSFKFDTNEARDFMQ